MTVQDLLTIYASSPQVGALAKTLGDKRVKTVFLEGLLCSSAPMVFGALPAGRSPRTAVFILQDADEAGYFYHDLVQLLGDKDVLFFPSSYRRAIKYAQRDSANEILRTEVLAKLTACGGQSPLFIVTYPEAIAELVVSKRVMDDRTVVLSVGDVVEVDQTTQRLRELGFEEVDYVYEPGQFALRGSILDVYSYSGELPFRIDLFGDDIDTIRTFEVETQLSKDRLQQVTIVPELAAAEERVSFLSFLPQDTLLVVKDFLYVRDDLSGGVLRPGPARTHGGCHRTGAARYPSGAAQGVADYQWSAVYTRRRRLPACRDGTPPFGIARRNAVVSYRPTATVS